MGESFEHKHEETVEDPFGKYFEGNTWELPTDLAVIGRAQDEIEKRLADVRDEHGNESRSESEIFNIGMGLREAIANAVIRGNMGAHETDADKRLDEINRLKVQNAHKKVKVSVAYDADTVKFVIADEGEGFDVKKIADPTDTEHKMITTGRGLLMMRSSFDSVTYNDKGNEVTLEIGDEGPIGANDAQWHERLPSRLKPEDVELFDGNDGQWHWHLRPNKIKDPERRKQYMYERSLWP